MQKKYKKFRSRQGAEKLLLKLLQILHSLSARTPLGNIEILHHIIDDPTCLSDREVGTDGKHERNFLIRAGLAEVALMVFTVVESCVFRVYRQIKFKSLAADSHLREKVSAHTVAVAASAVTALDLTVRREMFLKLRVPFDNAFIHF